MKMTTSINRCILLFAVIIFFFHGLNNVPLKSTEQLGDDQRMCTPLEMKPIRNYSGIKELEDLLTTYSYKELSVFRSESGYYLLFMKQESKVIMLRVTNMGDTISFFEFTPSLVFKDIQELPFEAELQVVRKIDPYGQYPFMYTGRNDIPWSSQHITSDGYYVVVHYSTEGLVRTIQFLRIF